MAQHQGEPSDRAEVSMMMTNERKIWEAALMLVRRHGSDALQVAEREAERLRSGDDELSCIDRGVAAPDTGQRRAHPLKRERFSAKAPLRDAA
jgi:hypothetical protein